MEITIPVDVKKRIEAIIVEEGEEVTDELVADITERLKGLWDANLYDDVADILGWIEEDKENN